MDELAQLRGQKDGAYHERNQLVAVLSKLFPSHLMIHPAADTTWEDGWRTIVCVHTPTVNAVWHFHDSERDLVSHLDDSTVVCAGWDGRSPAEKYERLAQLSDKRVLPLAAIVFGKRVAARPHLL